MRHGVRRSLVESVEGQDGLLADGLLGVAEQLDDLRQHGGDGLLVDELADGGEGGANAKDQYESWLYAQVCHKHTISLANAQRALATDWYTARTAAGRPRSATNGD